MTLEEIRKILPTLPEEPGCYQYFDEEGRVIYVGKAKNLRRRVSSYFQKEQHDRKTRLLVRHIHELRYIVVPTEQDALLLENALIKEHQPRYNILLKDDKSYPSIVVKNEPFPRIMVTRQIRRDGSTYFGPYPNTHMAHATVAMLHDLFPLRTCKLDLSLSKIREGKYRECLKYHIKKCKAPCTSKQTPEEYQRLVEDAISLLKGNLSDVIELYREEMIRLSGELRFEEAQVYKERLIYLENYQVKHTVASHHIHNVDVFSFERDEDTAYINYMHVSQGMINRAMTVEYKIHMDESNEELLAMAIVELRERMNSHAREIILPFDTGWQEKGITITIPQRGDKKNLLELSLRNVKQYKVDKYKRSEKLNPDQRLMQLMHDLGQYLPLPKAPMHIECFDNSHIQGADPVAACVVFRKGKPSKKDYRKYHLHSLSSPDDYESMREVTQRHYARYLKEGKPLPDLIIADGGKGQMSAIRDSLDSLGIDIPVAGLAKDDRHRTRELLYGSPPEYISVKHDSPTFRLMEQIQNEVHRFAISFHRDTRSKSQISSTLDGIKGIGPKTKEQLITSFRSVSRLREAGEKAIAQVVGKKKAALVYQFFHPEEIF